MTFYYTSYSDFPDSYLSDWRGDYGQEWTDEFRDFWGLDADEAPDHLDEQTWKLYRLLDRIIEKFSVAARTLQRPDGEDYTTTIKELREERDIDLTSIPFVRQRFEIEIFRELDQPLIDQADRALDLLELAVTVENHRARGYLERVAECYIRGLTTETVVMCGAVLEAALGEFVEDDDVRCYAGLEPRARVYTGHRLGYIDEQELLSQTVIEKAEKVNDDRNKAVHVAAEIVADPRQNIRLLADVLRALEPPEWLQEGEDPW